jgi:hypothetical protein
LTRHTPALGSSGGRHKNPEGSRGQYLGEGIGFGEERGPEEGVAACPALYRKAIPVLRMRNIEDLVYLNLQKEIKGVV